MSALRGGDTRHGTHAVLSKHTLRSSCQPSCTHTKKTGREIKKKDGDILDEVRGEVAEKDAIIERLQNQLDIQYNR